MSEFKPGEIVDITIKGARVVDVAHLKDCEVGVSFECDYGEYGWAIPLGPPEVTVERADPEWWPPRPSDLLRNASTGRFWFAVAIGSNTNLYNDRADQMEPQQAWEQRHRLTLVHREDQQDGGAS